jgi:beta-lactamase superfamily II metal-dependent hydrolase
MYRQGLGDCFLLSFPRPGRPFHMLIDCGVVMGPGDAQRMRQVAADIRKTTDGLLDLVVISHRHWTNISGFAHARAIFDTIQIRQLWMSWVEDPNNARAQALRRKPAFIPQPGVTRFSRTDETLEYLRTRAQLVQYLAGGNGPLSLSGVAAARVFILGPPGDSSNPLNLTAPASESPQVVVRCPFPLHEQISFAEAQNDPRFRNYFSDESSPSDSDPVVPGEEWRRIDLEQKGASRRPVRLDLEARANDTSLVLAIELTHDGSVLLFPGDAQTDSWRSWHDLSFPLERNRTCSSSDLLARTVLYKISHHGSQQGTPDILGLELMTSPRLVALLTIDKQEVARKRWRLPSPMVVKALAQKTDGRIISSEEGVTTPTASQESAAFTRSVRQTELYIDYSIELPQPTREQVQKSEANWELANERRVYLIDKKLAGTIKPEEEAELREIEELVDEYLSATAPRGFDFLEELRASLDIVKQAKKPRRRAK